MQEVPVFCLEESRRIMITCVHDITVLYLHQLPERNIPVVFLVITNAGKLEQMI